MKIALTGGTGFLGRYIINAAQSHALRCWHRQTSDRTGISHPQLTWVAGDLGDSAAARELVDGCDAVVHSALYRPGAGFRGAEGDLRTFIQKNVIGTIDLIEAARDAGVDRFVFISTCAVHERILPDRKLDEAHPLWPFSHYGAHKAAIEKFIHSFGLGHGYHICSLRPTGIFGPANPIQYSRWFQLVSAVKRGERVTVRGGGKEVHAADVAAATLQLLAAPADAIRGEAFNCYDRYISEYDIATLAKEICGSNSEIVGEQKRPKHEIDTTKLRALGVEFGGETRLRDTIAAISAAA